MKKFSPPLSLPLALVLAACTVGPDYHKLDMAVPAAYKESTTSDSTTWKQALPCDDSERGEWWAIYRDPALSQLERQVTISNQNLQQAEAAYRAAVASADQTRAGLFPIVALNPSANRNGKGVHQGGTAYDLSAGANWTLDVWGKIRREVESSEADAEASAADLAGARLSAQGELATDYFALRIQDDTLKALEQTVVNNQKILTIVNNQYKEGIAAQSDMLSAQAQVESAQAQVSSAQIKRAQLEHAVAVLVGRAPAEFSLPAEKAPDVVPIIPPTLPAHLLERRPDISSAERKMAAANANIGVAEAAYFPDVTLSSSYGFSAASLSKLFNAASTLWSFGASASETLIDFGARDAASDSARALYDETVANYRQTVLTAFQAVEDNLVAQRILVEQEKAQSAATADARRAEQITLNQYKEGIVPYNNVLSAQVLRLSDEQALLTVRGNRLAASVALIEALGGGWDGKLVSTN